MSSFLEKTTGRDNRSLSQKPLGYGLAIVGGTLGGPLGWITSPIVLFVLNRILKEKDGKHPNRFLIWALAGIIGAPLSLAPIIGSADRKSSTPNTSSDAGRLAERSNQSQGSNPERERGGVTMANYNKLRTGMTYEQVVKILGEEGKEISSNDIAGYKNVMYMWKAGGFSVGNMNAMFQNGALVQKAQFELPE
ncbi:DUF3862 domain-containing protein [Cylindrospermopsis raciborskii]|uniref:DUF3862 domain-containing protein n=1 Tax=Cylindrospermopsis raciborskii TaxID=77022 RepID=UPI0009F486F5|nr:DUF3862 domain-containing protein [Cylindrospermopsis raciborskii]NLQ05068.1 DUF3862 domain-containing protein [Cylindrospermopsis raciborskii MVCC19]